MVEKENNNPVSNDEAAQKPVQENAADSEKKASSPEAEGDAVSNDKADKKANKTAKITNGELQKLKDENADLAKKVGDINDKLLRTVAEYDNFRKRSQKEKEVLYSDSKADVVSKILPVLDNFERASTATADFESYKKGIEMTVKQLIDAITSLGVESFGEKGDEFDAKLHNAVMEVEDESLPENSVAEVFVKGYKLGDRVIRHATVKVAN